MELSNIENPVCCFFDRGIYGLNDIEAVDFDNCGLFRAVFASRNKIKLLALPDHLGYIFSKCRKDYLNSVGKSPTLDILKNNYYGQQLLKLTHNNLFKYIEAEDWLEAMKAE